MISFVKISLPRRDDQHRGVTEGKLFPSFSPLFRGFRVDIAWISRGFTREFDEAKQAPGKLHSCVDRYCFANPNHSDIVQQAQFLLTPQPRHSFQRNAFSVAGEYYFAYAFDEGKLYSTQGLTESGTEIRDIN